MAMWKDFKAFAFKGNVLDLAVAVVIGAAFAKIISAVVDGLIMPLVGKVMPAGGWEAWAPGGIRVGLLLAALVDFLIVAAVLFIAVSLIKRAMAKPKAPAEIPADIKLLTEIRDELRAH